MKHVVSLMRVFALLVAALSAAPAAFALDSGDIFVTSLRGEVLITVNGAPKQVRAGGVLELPATVRTGHDGAIELRQGATTVSVGPDTLLDFPALERPGAPIDRIRQPRGNAFYDIGKREGRKLRVETPYLVGVVKGTQFNVAAQDDATTISLFEGRLEVRAADESAVVDLRAGEIAARRKGDKSIAVIKMDAGKQPTTAPRAQNNGSGGDGAGSARDVAVSASVDRPQGIGAGLAVSLNDPRNPAMTGNVGADVRAPGVAVTSDNPVSLAGGNAAANVAVTAAVGSVVDTNASVNVSAGANGVGADVAVGGILNGGAVGADVSTSTSVDVSTGGVSVDNSVSTSVIAGPAGVDVSTRTSIDVSTAGVAADVAAGAVIAAGPITVDTGTTTSVDVGTGSVSADLGTSTAVDTGPVTADLGTTTGVAVDTGGAVAVDTAAALGVAGTDVSAGVTAGVDVSSGSVDLGVSVGGVDLGLSADLGLGGSEPATDTGSSTTATDTGNTGTTDVGGLLDSLLRRPGRK
jgi:hypothetical protein